LSAEHFNQDAIMISVIAKEDIIHCFMRIRILFINIREVYRDASHWNVAREFSSYIDKIVP